MHNIRNHNNLCKNNHAILYRYVYFAKHVTLLVISLLFSQLASIAVFELGQDGRRGGLHCGRAEAGRLVRFM